MEDRWLTTLDGRLQSGHRHEILHEDEDLEKALSNLGLSNSQRNAVMELLHDQWEIGFDQGTAYGRSSIPVPGGV